MIGYDDWVAVEILPYPSADGAAAQAITYLRMLVPVAVALALSLARRATALPARHPSDRERLKRQALRVRERHMGGAGALRVPIRP